MVPGQYTNSRLTASAADMLLVPSQGLGAETETFFLREFRMPIAGILLFCSARTALCSLLVFHVSFLRVLRVDTFARRSHLVCPFFLSLFLAEYC